MLDRVFTLVVAVVLAMLVWLSASSRDQEMLDNVPVPVQIDLAPGQAEHYQREVTGAAQVPVSFTGPPARIRELRGQLQRCEVKVRATLAVPEERQNEARYLDTVRIDPADVHTPPGVAAVLVEGRNRIPVTLRRLVEKRLPVRFDPSPEDRVGQVVVEPATVLVRGPREVLDHLRSIPAGPCCLPQRPEATVAETLLVGPVAVADEVEGRAVQATPASVMLKVTVAPKRRTYELDAPIHFLCPTNFPRRPRFRTERDGKLALKIQGPASEEAPRVFAFVDLTAPGKFTQANASLYYDEPLQVQLPPGFQLAQPLPRFVAFELSPADPLPGGAVPPVPGP